MITAQKLVKSRSSRTVVGRANSFKISSIALALAGSSGCFPALTALAEGFRNQPAGTFDLGRAGGRIAQVDDSSAIANNPANLVDVKAPEANFEPSFVYFKADYQSPTG